MFILRLYATFFLLCVFLLSSLCGTQLVPPFPFAYPFMVPRGRGFTAVVLTYDRVNSLFKVVQQLAQVPSLVKVVVVWNNQKKAPPACEHAPFMRVCIFSAVLHFEAALSIHLSST